MDSKSLSGELVLHKLSGTYIYIVELCESPGHRVGHWRVISNGSATDMTSVKRQAKPI